MNNSNYAVNNKAKLGKIKTLKHLHQNIMIPKNGHKALIYYSA